MAPKKKPYTLDQAAWLAAYKHNIEGPAGKLNQFGYATRLNKAKGNPMEYNDGISPEKIKPHKSTATKSKNRFKQGGYLA